MKNIVVLDANAVNPGDLSWEKLQQLGQMTLYPRTAPNEVVDRCLQADIILTNKVVISADIMTRLPRLKYIGVLATGYNVVDVAEARRKGIVVTNIPAYSTMSVAQMTFSHILNLVNRVGHYAKENQSGRWSRNDDFCYWDEPVHELAGLTLGIVGLGSIGSKVAEIALAFGMEVFALTSKDPTSLPVGIQKTTLEGLLAVSDILSLHCPLNPQTAGMICKENIDKMKQGAFIINTGRGPLVVEQDVADALKSGKLGGYGADVLSTEPPAADNPLLSAPRTFITPHIAWATVEARTRLIDIATANVQAFLNGSPINVIQA